jgi:hypothetical protein
VTTVYPLTLHGTLSDDGLPHNNLTSCWSQVSGPARVYFTPATVEPDAQTPQTWHSTTTARFFTPGLYTVRLQATDGQQSTCADVTITVLAPTNQPPAAYAGGDLRVTQGTDVPLMGMVLDDNLPAGYAVTSLWTQVSGPGTVVIEDDTEALTTAHFPLPGEYTLRLTASDTIFTDADEINVTVLPGTNQPPHVYAGANQLLLAPTWAILHTEATDDGLPNGALEVAWSVAAAPGPVQFLTINGTWYAHFGAPGDTANSHSAIPGDYIFRLTASDGALSAISDVTITAVLARESGVDIRQVLAEIARKSQK